ncbi:MAG TPA: hypothetical protein VD931_22830 [Baekduia sp.]|nr:hypothetical protein [Baekduia sp.]
MLLRHLQGFNGYLSENEGDGSDNGGGKEDRGDDFEAADDELEDNEAEAENEDDKAGDKGEKKPEAKGDGDDKGEKKPAKMVPHARMKEAVNKERTAREAAEKKAAEAEAALKAKDVGVDLAKLNTEIEELEEKLDQAIADNNAAEKKVLRRELREKQMTLARAEATQLSMQATAMAVERVRYDSLVERLEAAHPVMNPDHDDYDQEVVDQIMELKGAYEATGLSSSEALKKAVKFAVPAAPAKKEEPKDDEDESPEAKAKAAEAEAKRKEEAVRAAQDAKRRQPGAAEKGRSSDSKGGGFEGNVAKMTDEEFEKLDPKELKRLRGD